MLRLFGKSLVLFYIGLAVVVAAWIWWQRGAVAEDAAFYLRYADNLVSGYGLVYNPGEYYESNTNFLWTLLLTAPFLFGWEPVHALQVIGVGIAVICLLLVFDIATKLSNQTIGIIAVVLLAGHYSFVAIAAIGLAPHLPAAAALASIAALLRFFDNPHWRYALIIGMCLSLLLITRLDATLLFAPCWLAVVWMVWVRRVSSFHPKFNFFLAGVVPLVVFAVYLAGKYFYYGDIFPATYYAKAGSKIPGWYNFTERGLLYLWLYVKVYGLVLVIPLCVFFVCRTQRQMWQTEPAVGALKHLLKTRVCAIIVLLCAGIVVLWCGYMLRIGGGYIGFRFMATIAPFLFLLIALALPACRKEAAAACCALLLAMSVYYQNAPATVYDDSDAIIIHKEHVPWSTFYESDYIIAGMGLRQLFGEFGDFPPFVKVATQAGGFAAFYSRLHTLEIHGWADPRVFTEGNYVVAPDRSPGHQIQAHHQFMRDQQINLVLGGPWIADAQERSHDFIVRLLSFYQKHGLYLQVVELPISEHKKILALYLTRNDILDDFFARNKIKMHTLGRH